MEGKLTVIRKANGHYDVFVNEHSIDPFRSGLGVVSNNRPVILTFEQRDSFLLLSKSSEIHL